MDNILLDSGAFSAWNKGEVIDIDAYIDFCLKFQDEVDYIVNLDVIPATPGQKKIPKEEIERSASKGWDNYEYMLSRGIEKEKLIHVFHQNEDFKWLRRMASHIPYIGLSPANDRTTNEKIEWLDDCMKYALDDKGYPLAKYHGFAVTSYRIMCRYPWYSVDSITWTFMGGMGKIFVPPKRNGKFRFDLEPWLVIISSQSSYDSTRGNKWHYKHIRPALQKLVDEYFEFIGVEMGESEFKLVKEGYKLQENEHWCNQPDTTVNGYFPIEHRHKRNDPIAEGERCVEIIKKEGVSNKHYIRALVNATWFHEFEKTRPKWPWSWKKGAQGGTLNLV